MAGKVSGTSPLKELRIGAVAEQLGVSASMIRAWERLGLRREAIRAGVHRTYTDQDVQLLRRAVYLRRVQGLNAPAILDKLRRDGLLSSSNGIPAIAKALSTGSHLRALRLQRGEALARVAAAVGISVGFLSNLERSQTGVSLGIMHRLAHHYGTTLSDFYYEANSPGPLIRRGQRRSLAAGDGVRMELLAWGKIAMEPHLFSVDPGKGSNEDYTHHGEEFLYLMSGRLTILLGEEEYRLVPGDSFYFESKVKHRWFNPGKAQAKILWINARSMYELIDPTMDSVKKLKTR